MGLETLRGRWRWLFEAIRAADSRSLWFFSLVIGSIALFGCSPRSGRPGVEWSAPVRLIDEEPLEFYEPLTSLPWRREVERVWDFRDPRVVHDWTVEGADLDFRVSQSGLHLNSSGAWMAIDRQVGFEAEAVSYLELDVSGFERGKLIVQWAEEPDGSFDDTCKIEHPVGDRRYSVDMLRIQLDEHPRWRHQIRRLRVAFSQGLNSPTLVRSMALTRLSLDATALMERSARPYKVELDSEVRNAILALPGKPLEVAVESAHDRTLAFAYGVSGRLGDGVLRIEWLGEDEERETLFTHRLSDEEGSEGWHDVRVDLGRVAEQRGKLRFSVELEDGLEPLRGGLFWAHPEVVSPPASSAPWNVVLVSIDTLRADHLSLYGYARETSPHLDALAAERGVTFEQVVAPASSTTISHASIFSGINAHRHGVQTGSVPSDLELLAEILRREGYFTQAITGGARVSPQVGFAQGFDRYRYFQGEHSYRNFQDDRSHELGPHVDRALAALDELRARPFFLFFHTYEVHAPYRVRQPFFDRFGGRAFDGRLSVKVQLSSTDGKPTGWKWRMRDSSGEIVDDWPQEEVRRLAIDRYDSAIAFTDQQLARLFDRLGDLGLLERTLLIVTSDHGEAFGEGGRITHGFLDDSNLLVPLIIVAPGGEPGRRVAQQVRSVDLMPTILDLLGFEVPTGLDGVSLRPLVEGAAAEVPDEAWSYVSHTNRGLSLRLGGRLKYIFDNSVKPRRSSRESLYDLRRDREEVDDLAASLDTSTLRQRAIEQLSEQTPGLLIELQNRGERTFTFVLSSVAISQYTVDSWDLPGGRLDQCCDGVLSLEVRPDDHFHLLIDAQTVNRFDLELRDESEVFNRADFISAANTPLRIERQQDGFTIGGSTMPDVGVEIRWRGRGDGPLAPGINAELRRQLEALGYVD